MSTGQRSNLVREFLGVGKASPVYKDGTDMKGSAAGHITPCCVLHSGPCLPCLRVCRVPCQVGDSAKALKCCEQQGLAPRATN
jgi:hypothetical protein